MFFLRLLAQKLFFQESSTSRILLDGHFGVGSGSGVPLALSSRGTIDNQASGSVVFVVN
jgi:hypothetical protein